MLTSSVVARRTLLHVMHICFCCLQCHIVAAVLLPGWRENTGAQTESVVLQ